MRRYTSSAFLVASPLRLALTSSLFAASNGVPVLADAELRPDEQQGSIL